MAEAFSDEELKGLKTGHFELTRRFSGRLVADWVNRFLATITADRKRIEECKDTIESAVDKYAGAVVQLADQTAEVERLRGALQGILYFELHTSPASTHGVCHQTLRQIQEIARQALHAGKEEK